MAIIRPFAALRPAAELAAQVAALPYDVYSREEALEAVKGRPYSFLNIDRPETQFPSGYDMYAPEVYRKAGELLQRQKAEGIYVKDPAPCYYIYTLTMDGRSQTGLAACSLAEDYDNGVIRRHENTRAEKEADRIRHVETCSAHTGPIFLACRPVPELKSLTDQIRRETPLYDFISEDGIRHQVWRICSPEDIENISQSFADIPHLYIADGHHRAASAVKAGLRKRAADPGFSGTEEYNYFLSVVFPSDELNIYDYNRIVTDKNNYTTGQLLDMIKDGFEITRIGSTAFRPEHRGEFGMYLDHCWYRLTTKPSLRSEDPVKGLDVSILQDHILSPILGITDPKNDPRIRFSGGIRGLKALEEGADPSGGVAFAMFPTSMDELMAVADAGLLMPPKSTWFEPKLRSGLFIHRF